MLKFILQLIGVEKRKQSTKLLDYDFEKVLQQCGFLCTSFSPRNEEYSSVKLNLINFIAYFLTLTNTMRIVLTMAISNQVVGLTLCDIGILFGNTKLLGNGAFLSCYLSTIAILWAFSAINRRESHSDWISIYFVGQKIQNLTNDESSWHGLRKIVNMIYIMQTSVMMGLFFPANACLICSLLFVPHPPVSKTIQLPIWILSQGGNFIMLRGVQTTFVLFNSYCFVTKFRLDGIQSELARLESKEGKYCGLEIDLIVKHYMSVYLDTKKANRTLSVLVGSVYCATFALIILMLFIALYSTASPLAKLIAILTVFGATALGITAINLAGRFAISSVSLGFTSFQLILIPLI